MPNPVVLRKALLTALCALDDEALQYVALACLPSQETPGAHIWPDGVGGFTGKAGIARTRVAARAYLELPAKRT